MKINDQLEPTIFMIFGGAGDLTNRKLIPALFDLAQDRSMPSNYAIICIDRVDLTDDKLRHKLEEGTKEHSRNWNEEQWKKFANNIFYLAGDFKSDDTYKSLDELLLTFEKDWGVQINYIFYMAVPPFLFPVIPKYLQANGLIKDKKRTRLVVEKPLGYDIKSAIELNEVFSSIFEEQQIFRIDHYLGKETIQNILAFRFANPIFEPLWNRRYVDFVAITVSETIGVEHRGNYYDSAGALRDILQNHMMQLLCLVAMEPMVSFDADEIRNKKIDVLHAVRPITKDTVHDNVVRGQYSGGWIDGEQVMGYREEENVNPNSDTETFVALRLYVDNWRWQGVPFYLRTGKRLKHQNSEITIQFKRVPHQCFPPESSLDWQASRLILSIQPLEEIVLRLQAKEPGPKMHLRSVDMHFSYAETFKTKSPEAYETLLWDVMSNDVTLFMRADQVEAAWKLLMPILEMWEAAPPSDFPNYEAGSWGPEASNALLAKQGHSWPQPHRESSACPEKMHP